MGKKWIVDVSSLTNPHLVDSIHLNWLYLASARSK